MHFQQHSLLTVGTGYTVSITKIVYEESKEVVVLPSVGFERVQLMVNEKVPVECQY
jgi:hypothetical protein